MPRGRKKLSPNRAKQPVLVDRRGGIRKKAVQAYIDEINNSNLQGWQKQATIFELDEAIARAHNKKKRLTTNTFEASAIANQYEQAVRNAGFDYDEFLDFYGFDYNDWENPANWKDDVFTDPITGNKYQFIFKYKGSIIKEL